jgi:hypothetical protein
MALGLRAYLVVHALAGRGVHGVNGSTPWQRVIVESFLGHKKFQCVLGYLTDPPKCRPAFKFGS